MQSHDAPGACGLRDRSVKRAGPLDARNEPVTVELRPPATIGKVGSALAQDGGHAWHFYRSGNRKSFKEVLMLRIVLMLFLAYFVLYEPLIGRWLFRRFAARVSLDTGARMRYYGTVMTGIWVPTVLVLLLCGMRLVSPAALGIRWPELGTSMIGRWPSIVVLTVVGALSLLLLYQLVAARLSADFRRTLQNAPVAPELAMLLPRSDVERRMWTMLSLSAGLTEELLYRGFLTYLLLSLFPAMSVYLVLLIAAFLFGLAHSYQGLSGMLKTLVYGGLLAALYMACGSLLPGILLHFLTDLTAKDAVPARAEQSHSAVQAGKLQQ